MSYYAYIDESGTAAGNKIMTVSLVLLEGRRAADRISHRILKELHPHLANDVNALMKLESKRRRMLQRHFNNSVS